mmetsp:Transcript_39396/g.58515  ORF Transcript_39396/g.58515 Transcript_39396/m.58515 type:complete len:86 (-) Transcript_39396:214-471(-)
MYVPLILIVPFITVDSMCDGYRKRLLLDILFFLHSKPSSTSSLTTEQPQSGEISKTVEPRKSCDTFLVGCDFLSSHRQNHFSPTR